MSDNLKKSGGQDRQRINIHEDYELRDWSKKLGVTQEQLKEAVQAVGDRAAKVESYLKGNERGTTGDKSSDKSGGKSSER